MTPVPSLLQPLLDRILDGEQPRAVLLIDGEIVSCPVWRAT
jgi:hypothetical protein